MTVHRGGDGGKNKAETGAMAVIGRVRLVPVLTVADAADAPGLAVALLDGGLPVMEITLRTETALDAIELVAEQVPDIMVGAGSVTTAAAAASAIDAGARFVVSPGLDDGVVETARDRRVATIPGIATPTELLRATALGLDVVKVFPAEIVGGPGLIEALSAVWPGVRFLPTGGITADNALRYLALPPVLAVGGSWMAPRSAIVARDWPLIAGAAAAAVALASEVGSG